MSSTADRPVPRTTVFVTGTGTDIGKTWVTARLCERAAARGTTVAARKPAQSFDPGDVEAGRTDAQVLARATGAEVHDVCPAHRWYEVAMAPPMAADALGRPPIALAELVDELRWPVPCPSLGLVETAGGVRSPLAADGDTLGLIRVVAPTWVLLVADAGLGTINDVLLSLAALDSVVDPARTTVLLNRFDGDDDLHHRNLAWLAAAVPQVVTADLGTVFDHLNAAQTVP